MKAYIKCISSYLPDKILSNEELAEQYTEWSIKKIEEKTGIKKRHIIAEDETVSDMAVSSVIPIFKREIIQRSDIDYILLCTQSPDYLLPTTACIVQDKLELNNTCGAIDFNLGCSGYVYGLSLAKGLIESNQAKNILLITSESYSRYINKGDKSVRSLFGDGATSTLLCAADDNKSFINSIVFGTDGSGADNLMVPHGGSQTPINKGSFVESIDRSGNIRAPSDLYMNGSEVMVFTLKTVPRLLEEILKKENLSIKDVDYFVLHQANKFLLSQLQKLLKIPNEKFLTSFEEFGNTVSSTIPLGLLKDCSRFSGGDKIVLMGFGVGYSWSGCVVTWSDNFI